MISAILLVVCCTALAGSAPTELENSQQQQQQSQQLQKHALLSDKSQLEKRPVLLFGPQSQIELQPAFRLQQPLFQSLLPLGRIQGPNEQSMMLFYPNAPLSSAENVPSTPLLKQDPAQIFFDQFWGFIQSLPVQGGSGGDGMQDTPAGGGGGGGGSPINVPSFGSITQLFPGSQLKPQSSNIELEPEAEEIPKQPQLPQTPASTYPLPNYPNFIYYTIGATPPQFFGNFDYLKKSQLPFFRWPESDQNKGQRVLDPIKEISKNEETKIQPIPAAEPSNLPLKAVPSTPEKATEELENKPGEAARRFSQFLLEQKIYQPQPILIRPEYFDKSLTELKSDQSKQLSLKGEPSKEESSVQQSNSPEEPSIAQTHPVAVALTGKGGLARSAPLSTSIVGNNGIALSSPAATSVSGNFQDEPTTINKSNDNN